MRLSTQQHGFSLLELMITLSIIGIMMSMAIPVYSHYLVAARRAEAKTVLSKLALAMEKYHVENNTYQNATLVNLRFIDVIADNNYQLAIQSAAKHDYVLVAKPLNKQAKHDTACGVLTLNSVDEKGISGTGKMTDCW